MNQVPEERKDSVTKTLAILGFVAIIILIVWLAVKVVALIPGAFSSLASIADSVYNSGNKELIVSTKNSVVNTGEAYTVSWTKMSGGGSYGFQYDCTDGVSVDIRKSTGAIQTIACDTFVDLEDDTEIDMTVTAEKNRFTDVVYTIVYTQDGAENIYSDNVITVVNASIPTLANNQDTVEEEETTEPTVATPTTPTVSTPTTPTYTAGEPTVVKKYIYKIPESDPNGKIDLQITHLGVGTINNGIFTPLARLDENKGGAIQFEIKNIGTKTADKWSYKAELPSSITYESGAQKALKPNEKAIITLGFDGIARTGLEQFGATVTANGDVNKANNSYTWYVEVVK